MHIVYQGMSTIKNAKVAQHRAILELCFSCFSIWVANDSTPRPKMECRMGEEQQAG